LNHLNIEPQVLEEERCCGHDQLWEGDRDTFRALAEINIEKLKESGAQRVITTCPECARTLKVDYPEFVADHGLQILHLVEFLATQELTLTSDHDSTITYQDPCNLGRHMGVYNEPREILADLGYDIVEMQRSHNAALCCGTSCWRACGQVSKSIQVERLKEAKATGAETLVTNCIKCQIHFKCAQNDPIIGDQIDIEIRDLTTIVAENLEP